MNRTSRLTSHSALERQAQAGIAARHRYRLGVLAGLAILFLSTCSPLVAQQSSPPARERLIKVAYIHKFTRYVSWPDNSFAAPDSPFVIGVLGEDPFGSALDALQKRKVAGRPIVVRRYAKVQEIKTVHLLFVTDAAARKPELLRRLLRQTPNVNTALIVGETPGMAAAGAAIGFFDDPDGTIGFELNVDALGRHGLHADAKLLSVSKVVRDGESRR
ncbi:MAG: YfiR family protein [Pirellulales bacterium]|nr:YfiR family protein [Pirellulales bacterium]